jgi:hypothetical protein
VSRRLPTIRELTEQLQAQGEIVLALLRESRQRSKLEIANRRSAIMAEEARADLPEVARDADYGTNVFDPVVRRTHLDEAVQIIQKNIAVANDEIIDELKRRTRRR